MWIESKNALNAEFYQISSTTSMTSYSHKCLTKKSTHGLQPLAYKNKPRGYEMQETTKLAWIGAWNKT